MSILVGIADEEAARPAPDLAEALAALAHRRRVDDRQHDPDTLPPLSLPIVLPLSFTAREPGVIPASTFA